MLQHFLTFDKLIGTKLIKVLYYLGLLGIVLSGIAGLFGGIMTCLLYTSPSPRDATLSRMPSSA